MDGAPRLTVHALNKDEQHGKHKVNTTKIIINHSPDTGIEPKNSDMPEKRATFTPLGHLFSHSLSYYKYTQVNNIV